MRREASGTRLVIALGDKQKDMEINNSFDRVKTLAFANTFYLGMFVSALIYN